MHVLNCHQWYVRQGERGRDPRESLQSLIYENWANIEILCIFQEYSRESNALFEGTSSIYFGDIAPFRTPAHSPSPSRNLKRPPRVQNNSSLPTWVEPLGVWLTNKQVFIEAPIKPPNTNRTLEWYCSVPGNVHAHPMGGQMKIPEVESMKLHGNWNF